MHYLFSILFSYVMVLLTTTQILYSDKQEFGSPSELTPLFCD